jgi:hypothetical protein
LEGMPGMRGGHLVAGVDAQDVGCVSRAFGGGDGSYL